MTCCRLSQIERMDLLLNQIKNAVKLDGSVFKLFLDILQEIDTLLASKFAAKLLESYDHKEQQVNDLSKDGCVESHVKKAKLQ